jgi:hypothetical protein
MSEYGTCESGCSENKLDLVRAVDLDIITALTSEIGVRVSAYRILAEELATTQPGPGEHETAYRSLQTAARAVLRRYAANDQQRLDEPDRATTWWCSGCGGIDAPQPCLGICIWRRVDWVNAQIYDREHKSAVAGRDTELRLRALLRPVASITPRERHWKLGWRTMRAQAQRSLRNATVHIDTRAPSKRAGRERTAVAARGRISDLAG